MSLGSETRMEGLGAKSLIIDGDWTFVTRNSIDFRGPRDAPGSKGQCADVAVHAGLICLNGPVRMDLDLQLEMFEEALDELDRNEDLVNEAPLSFLINQDLGHHRRGARTEKSGGLSRSGG